jgi:protein TonB
LVILSLTVTREGNAADVRVEQSAGFDLLDKAALEAVKQWRFTPARVGQTVINSQVEIPIRFRLSD